MNVSTFLLQEGFAPLVRVAGSRGSFLNDHPADLNRVVVQLGVAQFSSNLSTVRSTVVNATAVYCFVTSASVLSGHRHCGTL